MNIAHLIAIAKSLGPIKWVMFLNCVGLVVNYALSLHEKKFRRIEPEKGFYWVRIFLMLLSGLLVAGLCIANVIIIKEPPKSPAFLPFVNGVALSDSSYITVPTTNRSGPLEFWVQNAGH